MSKKILVTGAGGYVGSSLVKKLRDFYGYDVVGITRQDCDLMDSRSIAKWASTHVPIGGRAPFDFLIHCAAVGGHRLNTDNSDVLYNNLVMFNHVLAFKGFLFDKLINVGSGAEYDKSTNISPFADGLYHKDIRKKIAPLDPYGMSKYYISQHISNTADAYNMRIFGVFDENELSTRFIKNSINSYIDKKPISIFRHDLQMDFIYMDDFVYMTKCVIEGESPFNDQSAQHIKQFDCIYDTYDPIFKGSRSLEDIVKKVINKLDDYEVPVHILDLDKGAGLPVGSNRYLGTPPKSFNSTHLIGLVEGIKRTYQKIKESR